jgi:hypothetical protein
VSGSCSVAQALAQVVNAGSAFTFIEWFAREWCTPLRDGDWCTATEVAAAEGRLGLRLPDSLAAFYRLLGRRRDLTSSQDTLIALLSRCCRRLSSTLNVVALAGMGLGAADPGQCGLLGDEVGHVDAGEIRVEYGPGGVGEECGDVFAELVQVGGRGDAAVVFEVDPAEVHAPHLVPRGQSHTGLGGDLGPVPVEVCVPVQADTEVLRGQEEEHLDGVVEGQQRCGGERLWARGLFQALAVEETDEGEPPDGRGGWVPGSRGGPPSCTESAQRVLRRGGVPQPDFPSLQMGVMTALC